MLIYCAYILAEQDDLRKEEMYNTASVCFAIAFLLEFVGITVLVIMLTKSLYDKKRVMHKGNGNQNFRKGTCILMVIMFVFGISFLLRFVNDIVIIDTPFDPSETMYGEMVYDIVIGIPFDLLPLGLIIFLHRKNFQGRGRPSR